MLDFLFAALFFTFPVGILLLAKYCGLRILEVSVPSFLLLSIFAFAYTGILPLYFGWDDYRYLLGVRDKALILDMYFYTAWSIFGIFLGYIFSRNVLGFHIYGIVSHDIRRLNFLEKLFLMLFGLICVVILIVYLNKVPSIAIFVAIEEGVEKAQLARSHMGNDFTGKYHWYSLIIHDLLNLLTFIIFACWLIWRRKFMLLLFLMLFLISVFTAVMATEKGRFAWLLIGLYFTYLCAKKDTRIPIFGLVKLAAALIIPLIGFYVVFMGSQDALAAIKSIFSRSFTGSISPAYFYLEYFPKHHDFLWGRSFPNPGGLLPYDPYRLTVEIKNWTSPGLMEKGVVGSSPTVFWGEMYANFGLLGVIISPFVLGVAISLLAYLIGRLENTPIKLGLLVWVVLHFQKLSRTGLSGFIIDFYFILIALFVMMIIILSNRGRIRLISKRGNHV